MEHHYRQALENIAALAADLLAKHWDNTHAYWLHIDGDKLATCEKKLQSMVDAIEDEQNGN